MPDLVDPATGDFCRDMKKVPAHQTHSFGMPALAVKKAKTGGGRSCVRNNRTCGQGMAVQSSNIPALIRLQFTRIEKNAFTPCRSCDLMENIHMEQHDNSERIPGPYQDPPECEHVRLLAYQLWQARGCPFGTSEVDWFQAEDEIRARRDRPDSETTIITVAKTIGSVLGSVAGLVSSTTGGPPNDKR